MISLDINGKKVEVEADPSTPVLWVLRDQLGLIGTKYSCGMGLCGACTVHLDGAAVRSCQTPVKEAASKTITTIEGLGDDHPVVKGWIEAVVPQCGYCQSGQIMEAAGLLKENPDPSDADIDRVMSGNLCRCGTYERIRKAIHLAAGASGKGATP